MTQPTSTDLQRFGWARSFPGFWLRPDGMAHVSEQDAIREVAAAIAAEQQEATQNG